MYTKTLILALLLGSGYASNAQWIQSTSATFFGASSVAYPTLNAAYVTGNSGELLKSTDGGVSWTEIYNFGPFSSLTDAIFVNADTGFVSVSGGVRRTFDGGTNWTPISPSWGVTTGLHFNQVKIGDQRIFASFASNDSSIVVSSDDYGTTFDTLFILIKPNAYALHLDFLDSLNGYFIDPHELNQVLSTSSACQTMDTTFVTNGPINLEQRFEFSGPLQGFLYGDWGNQAQPSRTTTNTYYIPIDLDGFGVLPVLDMELDQSTLYASSLYGKIFASTNGGQTWYEQTTPVTSPVYAIAFADALHGIAVSDSHILYTNTGGAVGIQEVKAELASVFPNPATSTITVVPEQAVVVNSIRLTDSSGNLVRAKKASSKLQFDVSGLNAGIYFIELDTNKGRSTIRFVKE